MKKLLEELYSQFAGYQPESFTGLWNYLNLVVINVVQKLLGAEAPGPEKKAAALELLASLFDAIPVVPVPWYLLWIRGFRPLIRQWFLDAGDALIEKIYPVAKQTVVTELKIFPAA
jgi:hypothetical protein